MKKSLLILIIFSFLIIFTNVSAINRGDILINEIAWMGDTSSEYNEWIEIFNNTNNQIDLSQWVLKSSDDKLKINLGGTIPANGFYLLERTDDNSVLNITADLIYRGNLLNSGMNLKLYDSLGYLADEVDYRFGWPAGDNKTKQTMERVNLGIWQISQNPNGTPKNKNSNGATSTINKSPIINTIYSEGIFINEILPSPEGPDELDEWVEIFNNNNYMVDLSGWKLKDTSGKVVTYIIPNNTNIGALGYLVFKRPETKITLNDDKDGLNLVWPNGKAIYSINYEAALKNQSYNRIISDTSKENNWGWSINLTPGNINIINPQATINKLTSLSKQNKSDNNSVAPASINEGISQIFNNFSKDNKSVWLLFFISVIIIIVSGGIILFIKFKNNERS